MSVKMFTFYEYQGFRATGSDAPISTDIRGISSDPGIGVRLERLSQSQIPGESVFQVSPSKIKAKHYVGVISTNSFQFEILPKLISSGQSDSDIRANLIKMLATIHDLEINENEVAALKKIHGSFLEVYMRIFASRLLKLIVRELPQGYVTYEENLPFVRGKIKVTRNALINHTIQTKIFCEFDELSIDTLLNQVFKYVATALYKITQSIETKNLLRQILNIFDSVTFRKISADDLKRIALRPGQTKFQPVLNMARMFIENSACEMSNAHFNCISVIFNMNELFEEYLYRILKKNRQGLGIKKIHYQKGKRLSSGSREWLIADEYDGKSRFNTFSDIQLEMLDGRFYIIDVKYKMVGRDRAHFGVSNADVYQILAYSQIHSQRLAIPLLVYPENLERVAVSFKVTESEQEVYVVSLNLHEQLSLGSANIVQQLSEYINRLAVISSLPP